MIHEDDRRVLSTMSYKEGEIKLIKAKRDCDLGHHYHLNKTEKFIAITPGISSTVDGFSFYMVVGKPLLIQEGAMHSFKMPKDGVLLCICSKAYDPNDDYK